MNYFVIYKNIIIYIKIKFLLIKIYLKCKKSLKAIKIITKVIYFN